MVIKNQNAKKEALARLKVELTKEMKSSKKLRDASRGQSIIIARANNPVGATREMATMSFWDGYINGLQCALRWIDEVK